LICQRQPLKSKKLAHMYRSKVTANSARGRNSKWPLPPP